MIVILLTFFVAFDFLTNLFNWQNGLNTNSNLSSNMKPLQFYIEYPQNAREVMGGIVNGSYTPLSTDVMFIIQVTDVYNSTLTIGQPFYIYTIGEMFPKGQEAINQVVFAYQSSSEYSSPQMNVIPLIIINFTDLPTYDRPVLVPDVNNLAKYKAITWNSEGEYYPYAIIDFKNGTILNYPLNNGNVYVNGLNVLQQQEFNLQQADAQKREVWIIVDIFLLPITIGFTALILKVKIKDYI